MATVPEPEFTLTFTAPELQSISNVLKAAKKGKAGTVRFNRYSKLLARFHEAMWLAEPANEAAKKAQDQ